MSYVRRLDHVGITVADIDTVTAFFVGPGLEVEAARTFVEGEFLDTVIGIPDSRTEIVMLRPPDGGTRRELSSFVRPNHQPGSPAAMANELGLRNLAFEVDDLQAAVNQLASDPRRRPADDRGCNSCSRCESDDEVDDSGSTAREDNAGNSPIDLNICAYFRSRRSVRQWLRS
jgi:catechol 2,3-dioxygenase-like lactoylglutathione lyase family enzyme